MVTDEDDICDTRFILKFRGIEERMKRKSWDAYFIDIAHAVASRATCDRKHVGAVIVIGRRIVSTGYNGSIPGAAHCDDVGHDLVESVISKDVDYPVTKSNCVRTVHAEANAIAQAARFGLSLDGSTLYCNTFPCWPCFKLIASSGIVRVVYDDEYREDPRVRAGSGDANIVFDRYVSSGSITRMDLPPHAR